MALSSLNLVSIFMLIIGAHSFFYGRTFMDDPMEVRPAADVSGLLFLLPVRSPALCAQLVQTLLATCCGLCTTHCRNPFNVMFRVQAFFAGCIISLIANFLLLIILGIHDETNTR